MLNFGVRMGSGAFTLVWTYDGDWFGPSPRNQIMLPVHKRVQPDSNRWPVDLQSTALPLSYAPASNDFDFASQLRIAEIRPKSGRFKYIFNYWLTVVLNTGTNSTNHLPQMVRSIDVNWWFENILEPPGLLLISSKSTGQLVIWVYTRTSGIT